MRRNGWLNKRSERNLGGADGIIEHAWPFSSRQYRAEGFDEDMFVNNLTHSWRQPSSLELSSLLLEDLSAPKGTTSFGEEAEN